MQINYGEPTEELDRLTLPAADGEVVGDRLVGGSCLYLGTPWAPALGQRPFITIDTGIFQQEGNTRPPKGPSI